MNEMSVTDALGIAHVLADENERLRKVVQEVAGLAAEWERFGLQGAAQRLRHILGEVTS